jgi:sulfopropanediol 3-dehydrogenase
MTVEYLKKATPQEASVETSVADTVREILETIEQGGESVAREYCQKFDQWQGDIVVPQEQLKSATDRVPEGIKRDIEFAYQNVKRFAEAQRETVRDTEIEVVPGLIAGQKQIPINSAGCYVPGGRYSHIASAIMTVTTAKVAGVKNIIACSPPSGPEGIPDVMLYTLDLCGADIVLNMGGVQGIAAMTYGLFDVPAVDILVGPGNQFVAEAKRQLYGKVSIDMFAGPTESMVIADASADPEIVAWDLVGQAEHGYNSPVWLISLDKKLAEEVIKLAPTLWPELPELNAKQAELAWENYAEVIVVDSVEEAVKLSDQYAAEHLQVQCENLDWWLDNLTNYGSLFLGEETTVAYGDKVSGPNHVLPTQAAARYSGGLSVHKYMKTVTWQKMTREANRDIGQACARISRYEGMDGHAKTADVRLKKFFPDEQFLLRHDS